MTPRRAVVGVIGHVDHGKTALVRALTGMETDRLEEERRRGISIALGFAYLRIHDAVIDLIDMPGHERFVRTMVSGATGVDAALLVVAANEGIKPQTVEHLDIAGLLGLRRAIVAVTKADLVPPGQAEAVGVAAAQLAEAAGLQVGARVLTSVHDGLGIAALADALAAVVPDAGSRGNDGFPYLPIDRVFSVAGHGTVVTGTLRRGPLGTADEMALAPQGRPVRLRGLQVHGARTVEALPGQRLAVNLRDVAAADIARGAALTARGMLPASEWLTVSLRAVPGAPALPTGTKLMLLFGTEELEARLRLLECDELAAGGRALAQLRCAAPVALPAREHFILRRISPPLTIAGGRVIDPAATRLRRHAPRTLARLAALAGADPARIVAAEIDAAGAAGIPLARLAQLAGLAEPRTAALLPSVPAMLGASRVVVATAEWERLLASLPGALPRDGAETPSDRLAALLPWAGRAVLDDAVADLVRRGALVRGGGGVRPPAPARDRARADQESAAAAAMADRLAPGRPQPARHLDHRARRPGQAPRRPAGPRGRRDPRRGQGAEARAAVPSGCGRRGQAAAASVARRRRAGHRRGRQGARHQPQICRAAARAPRQHPLHPPHRRPACARGHRMN